LKVVILQSNYLPWKGYFDLINDADIFVYYDEVQYTKNDWRNRNKIYTINGEQWITIPISKEAVKQKISEALITDKFWQELHFKSIYLAYKRAPYFHQLEPLINEVYIDKKWDSLSNLNRFLIEKISKMIGINTQFVDSKNFDLSSERTERLISILKQLNATEYISGPAAKNYLQNSENIFSENNIQLTYKNYSNYPTYKQLNNTFSHNVSIIDLIANIKLEEIKNYVWDIKK